MAATAPIPTLPGVTEEQVLEAMEIVERVYAEAGVPARIELRRYHDPDIPGSDAIEIVAAIEDEVPLDTLLALVRAVPSALRSRGLYQPEVPISSFYDYPW